MSQREDILIARNASLARQVREKARAHDKLVADYQAQEDELRRLRARVRELEAHIWNLDPGGRKI